MGIWNSWSSELLNLNVPDIITVNATKLPEYFWDKSQSFQTQINESSDNCVTNRYYTQLRCSNSGMRRPCLMMMIRQFGPNPKNDYDSTMSLVYGSLPIDSRDRSKSLYSDLISRYYYNKLHNASKNCFIHGRIAVADKESPDVCLAILYVGFIWKSQVGFALKLISQLFLLGSFFGNGQDSGTACLFH